MDQNQKKGATMERKKTMTMNWDGLGEDDDDDCFFETFDRLSSAISLDLASSGSDDDEFDDSRMSFASTIPSAAIDDLRGFETANRGPASIFGDYDMWMAEPGSIKDRRRQLLQGMGLTSTKNLLSLVSTKLMHVPSKKVSNDQPSTTTTVESSPSKQSKSVPEPKPDPKPEPVPEPKPELELVRSMSIVHVRSRSDGDIESFSANTRRRKEEFIGTISKQRLTRTSSMLLAAQSGICQYANTARGSPKRARTRSSIPNSGALPDILSDGQFSAFFLIKNLDTGKEFIVKEYNNEGMWNRLSEVQTGKQLSMEEFEKSVGYSPVVKELLHRENSSRHLEDGKKVGANAANSYLTKSFRNSKRRGVALLKNIRGVANSMSGLIADKERENPSTEDQQNSSSKWIKVRQQGKSIKEFTALHLCQEIQAHEGSIWTMKFSLDAHYLASAGEDRIIHVWEVQECEVMSAKPLDDWSSPSSTPLHPMAGNLSEQPPLAETSPMPSERKKERPPLPETSPVPSEKKKKGKASNKKKGNSIPDYVNVPETVFSLSEKPVCSFTGHQDDVLDLSWSKSQVSLSPHYRYFQCRDVSVAIPWPGSIKNEPPIIEMNSKRQSKRSILPPASTMGSPSREDSMAGTNSKRQLPPLPKKTSALEKDSSCQDEDLAQISRTDSEIGISESFNSDSSSVRYGDSPSISTSGSSPSHSWSSRSLFEGSSHGGGNTIQATAWGLVIVTAGKLVRPIGSFPSLFIKKEEESLITMDILPFVLPFE